MVLRSRLDYLEAIRSRYRRAAKEAKSHILDEFCETCGYNRKYAIRLLGKPRKKPAGAPAPRPSIGTRSSLKRSIGHLGLHDLFKQAFGELLQQAVLAYQSFGFLVILDQLVKQVFGNGHVSFLRWDLEFLTPCGHLHKFITISFQESITYFIPPRNRIHHYPLASAIPGILLVLAVGADHTYIR